MSDNQKYIIRYLNKEEFLSWDSFIEESGMIFHGTKHLENLAKALKLNFSILGVYNADQQLIAGFAFVYNTRFGISNIYKPPLTPFYSPIIKHPDKKYPSKIESYKHNLVNSIIKELSKKYKIINLTLPPNEIDIRPYSWMGFTTDVLYTYSSTLDESIISGMNYDPDIKRRIKKAQNLNFDITQGISKKFIDACYDLQLKSYRRQGYSFVLNNHQFADYITEMGSNGNIMIYIISQKAIPVSGVTILYRADKAYYLLAGSDPEFLSLGLNQVLFDFIAKDLYKKGVKIYDLVGANSPTVAHYKSTYNFSLQPYYNVRKIFGLKAKCLMNIKTLYEKLRK